jgi:sugar/nucleoside kinase (ribokinase family)
MGKMYAPPERVVTQDLSGAGDTFMAALAVSMTRVGDAEDAIKFANECSATVVAKRGVTTI